MDVEKIKQGVRMLLEGIGEDPDRDGIRETPARVAAMYEEIYAGIGADPLELFTREFYEPYDEIVLVKNIPFYSVCEHHLMPFIGRAHVAYLPSGRRISGLSKLARLVELYAKRPQMQERLTTEVADALMAALRPKGTLVVVEAEHLCMTMRGVKAPGSVTVTSVVRGIFRENPATRAEAMALLREEG
ncbi:MAG: GTP cyclohydrolase I FolE [Candidatus Brocadiia bacterium]